MATLGMSAADRDAVEAFRRDVVEPSMSELVILDFWAEWCGPCKQLGPVLDKVGKDYAGKGVRLVKIDVDKDKFIAAQFQIRSIPTVYALFQGQPVADLTSARTESQLARTLDQLLAQLPVKAGGGDPAAADVAEYVAMADEVLAAGDAQRALGILEQVAEMAPEDVGVTVLLARALVALGRAEEAAALLDALPADAKAPGLDQARAALALARTAGEGGDLAEARANAAGGDMQARLDLADALIAAGERDEAADLLLALIGEDRAWNEGAARARLLTLFAAVGLEDPWVAAQRRRLSAVLFT